MCDHNGATIASGGATPQQRQSLYTGVCVPGRLFLIVLTIALSSRLKIGHAYPMIVIGLIGLGINIKIMMDEANGGCRWWKPLSSVLLSAASVCTGGAILGELITPQTGGFLLAGAGAAHLAFGVTRAMAVRPWSV